MKSRAATPSFPVRDNKNVTGPAVVFSAGGWLAFVAAARTCKTARLSERACWRRLRLVPHILVARRNGRMAAFGA
ncbi:DUF397 domain-containing protein [Streptomyces lunaelactis]|uniref:DUF397 domain-containing protein n=1 Tax=Streptomyces lunaelactis TaxID=1535768 RepID=UPI001C304EA9|nr:DUF397 domain-containing protein [Streptomyces lunaelactis]